MVKSIDELSLFIEKGIPDGHEYEYKEAADEYVNQQSGKIIFKVETTPHPTFTRDGNTLKTTVKISLKQALLGFEKSILHLDGHKVNIKRLNRITKPGEEEKIKGEGMPLYDYPSEYGELIIKYEVVLPTSLTEEQKTGFKQVF